MKIFKFHFLQRSRTPFFSPKKHHHDGWEKSLGYIFSNDLECLILGLRNFTMVEENVSNSAFSNSLEWLFLAWVNIAMFFNMKIFKLQSLQISRMPLFSFK